MFVLALAVFVMVPSETGAPSRRDFGYVHVSPGLGGFAPVADAAFPTWVSGVSLGYHFHRGTRFAGELGAFFDDLFYLEFPDVHELHAGPEIRLGILDDFVFVYALGRLGPATILDGTDRYVMPAGFIAPGVQALLVRHLVLGAEGGVHLGGEAFVQLRARIFVGARF